MRCPSSRGEIIYFNMPECGVSASCGSSPKREFMYFKGIGNNIGADCLLSIVSRCYLDVGLEEHFHSP